MMTIEELVEKAEVKRYEHHRRCAEDDEYTCWKASYKGINLCTVFERPGMNLDSELNIGIRKRIAALVSQKEELERILATLGVEL